MERIDSLIAKEWDALMDRCIEAELDDYVRAADRRVFGDDIREGRRVFGDGNLGRTMASLPQTAHFRPRPVMRRVMERFAGREPGEPTEVEKADAILILGEGYLADLPEHDPLYAEAERIFAEAGQ